MFRCICISVLNILIHDSWIQDSIWTEWLCLLARRMQSRPGPLRHVTPTPHTPMTSLQPPRRPMTGRFTRPRRAEVEGLSNKQTCVWFCWAAPSLLSDPSPVERKNKTPCFFVSKWMWRAEMRWGIVWSKSLLSSNAAFTFSSKLVGFRSLALWDSLGFWEASITTGNIILLFFFFNFFFPLVTDYTNQQHLELTSVGVMVILECTEKKKVHVWFGKQFGRDSWEKIAFWNVDTHWWNTSLLYWAFLWVIGHF